MLQSLAAFLFAVSHVRYRVVPLSAHAQMKVKQSMPVLRIVDSITELNPVDAGCVAVSGSHGGLSSARYALAARPLLSVFNDAGAGLDNAGLAALDFLQVHGLAACVVAHHSARIGEAQSTLTSGLVNGVNAAASGLGIQAGWTCQRAVDFLVTPQGR
jgi:hypothetical protein